VPELERDDQTTAAWVRRTTAAVSRGDRAALAEFYERWFDPCYAMARSLTRRDESYCLDVVQEVMMRVIKGLKPLESEGQLRGWMTRAVHSTVVDMLRRETRRARREEEPRPKSGTAAPLEEQLAWVNARLAELPGGDGALLALRVAQDRTLDAAGASEGISGDAAHGRIRRAMGKLKLWAKEVGDDHR
jgi:RNA polymerase sigma factor (sigma-70 family)